MIEKLKVWLQTPAGRIATGILLILACYLMYTNIKTAFGDDPGVAAANSRMFIDSNTGTTFRINVSNLKTIPCETPAGTKTGYPAEACFWTKEGTAKPEPTYVFVKEYAGSREPTYCPDCGRRVVQLNPGPTPGRKPPPLKGER